MSAPAKGEGAKPLTAAEKAAKTVERMKTETIHAQAMQLQYMRERLIALEDQVKQLSVANRTLELKLSAANRVINASSK